MRQRELRAVAYLLLLGSVEPFGALLDGAPCVDTNDSCAPWAADGECLSNAEYMRTACPESCNLCTAGGDMPKRPKTSRASCADEDEKSCSARAGLGHCHSNKTRMLLHCPRACQFCHYWKDYADDFDCVDRESMCATWAKAGECEKNKLYMSANCVTSCGTCGALQSVCDRPAATPPLVEEGGITETMERILRDFPQYSPKAVSRPGAGPKGKDSPWVVTLANVLSEEEADAFVDGCSSHFQRSLAGDQLSPVRTSSQCWCADNECGRNPLTQLVAERISNLTRAPIRYMEPFQVLKYEVGQFYRAHHDQNSGLFTPQGARIYTFFIYLNTPEQGGGTHFTDLDIVVPPVKGHAVLWHSVKDSDVEADEPFTHHEALPVEKGQKFSSNVWVHNYDYRTPAGNGCSLTHRNTR